MSPVPTDGISIQERAEPAMLHLLGRATFVRARSGNGDALRFLPERRFRLLAYVALRGDWVGRDELANLFWSDRTQEAARSNLRKLLLEVRALDLPQLESERNAIRWNVLTDVAKYKSALAAREHSAALALYAGPLLHGIDGGDSEAFSAWLQAERERLHRGWRDAALAALPRLAPIQARDLAQRLLDSDPYDEDALVAALDALGVCGEGAAAADVFRNYAERLIDELGIEPSARVRSAAARATGSGQHEATTTRLRATDTASSATPPAPHPANQPPALPGDFVGRARELLELTSLLGQTDCKLLTVTGPGGMGKSRLVKHAVREVSQRYPDGVCWVALDDLTDVAQVAPRIAAELKVELSPRQDPVERIGQVIASRRMLLVLDNSEHLPELSRLVESLLNAAPGLQLLTTSRARIGGPREWLLPLAGLDTTPHGAGAPALLASDAAQLFVAQARSVHPRFDATGNATAIGELVAAVGGMPLAILLAAGWVRLLPVAELAAEVAQSLDVLEREEEGDERPEHRSVRATFEQTWRLLTPAEQRALAALSVTTGGFTRAAANDIAHAPLPLLASLHDKALLQTDGSGRFSLHPLIQQFAAEKLVADSAAELASRGAHRRYFDQWLQRTSDVPRAEEPKAHGLIESELENLRAMWRHAIATMASDTLAAAAVPLMRFFELRSRWGEGQALLDATADALGTHATEDRAVQCARANVWRAQATLDFRAGLHARCIDRAEASLRLCRELGIRKGIKGNLNSLGLANWQLARRVEAAKHFAAAIEEARADSDTEGEALFLGNASLVAKAQGNYQEAMKWSQAALAVHRARDNKASIQTTLNNLGNLYRALQEPRQAIVVLTEALAFSKQHSKRSTEAFVRCNIALAHDDLGEYEQALVHAEASLTLLRTQGEPALESSLRQAFARALIGLGRFAEAQEHLVRALQLALAERRISVAVSALMVWGTALAAQDDLAQAIEILTFAANHPDIDGPDRDFAKRALAAIEQQPGPEGALPKETAAPAPTLEDLAARLLRSAGR